MSPKFNNPAAEAELTPEMLDYLNTRHLELVGRDDTFVELIKCFANEFQMDAQKANRLVTAWSFRA